MLIPHCSAHAVVMVAPRREYREQGLKEWVCPVELCPAECLVEVEPILALID